MNATNTVSLPNEKVNNHYQNSRTMCQQVMTATKRTMHNFCWQTKMESSGIELKPITHLGFKSSLSGGASLNHKGNILRCSGISGCSEVHSEIVQAECLEIVQATIGLQLLLIWGSGTAHLFHAIQILDQTFAG